MTTADLLAAILAGASAVPLAAWAGTSAFDPLADTDLDTHELPGVARRCEASLTACEAARWYTAERPVWTARVEFAAEYPYDGGPAEATAQAAHDGQRLLEAFTPRGNAALLAALTTPGQLYRLGVGVPNVTLQPSAQRARLAVEIEAEYESTPGE